MMLVMCVCGWTSDFLIMCWKIVAITMVCIFDCGFALQVNEIAMIASGTLLLSLVSVVRHHGLLSLPPFQRLLHKAVLGELQQLPIKVCVYMHVCMWVHSDTITLHALIRCTYWY